MFYPVFPNAYEAYYVAGRDAVKMINAVFAHWWAPVKLGGIFHVDCKSAAQSGLLGRR